jgi:prepilin-type N-terminal cleavage/methylation domain-containing protein
VLTAMRHQRGFTLIELLIALVMMGIVTAGLYSMLIRTQRLTRAQTEQLDLQSNVRTTALVVPSELRELNTFVGAIDPGPQVDITEALPTSITYRAMRGLGFLCQPSTATEIRLLKATWTGYRDPAVNDHGDGAYIFLENQKDLTSDDAWQQTAISSVTAGTCGVNTPAIVLTNALGAIPAGLETGTPVRTYERMKLALYQTGGKSYLGAQSVSGGAALEPLLGPLKDDDNVAPGLSFKYLDAAGNVTAAKANIKSIVLTVRGVTEGKISRSGGDHIAQGTDSLVTMISLRNAFR